MSKYGPWHNKTLIALCMEALVLTTGTGFVSPVLPKFVQALGVEPAQLVAMVGLVITAYGIARVVMNLPFGRLAHCWGQRPPLIIGRFLTSWEYATDTDPPQNYERTIALYRTVSDIGFVVGPILLGWLKDIKEFEFPFFLGTGLLLAAVTSLAAFAKETIGHCDYE